MGEDTLTVAPPYQAHLSLSLTLVEQFQFDLLRVSVAKGTSSYANRRE